MSDVGRRGALGLVGSLFTIGSARAADQNVPATDVCAVSDRAQRLLRIEEELNSPDASLRLATLEYIMQSGTPAEKTRALRVAVFGGADADLRDLALLYGLSQMQMLSVIVTEPTSSNPDAARQQQDYGTTKPFQITDFDLSTGRFSTHPIGDGGRIASDYLKLVGQVSGPNVIFSVRYASGGSSFVMNGTLVLRPNGTLSGQISFDPPRRLGPQRAMAAFL